MMPHIIPGGRQRASSDGDVLEDEDDTINASGVLDRLTEAHRNVSRSAILTTTDDDRDSDDPRSITDVDKISKGKKKGLRSKLSFKSVKKAVSRAFPIKDSLFGSSSSLNKEEMPTSVRASSASGVWTPTLRRRTTDDENDRPDGSHSHRSNRDGIESAGTDSMSRPLITGPEQMIAKWDSTPGNVGLFNHGNTCFMNAVLQCLSHTDSFTEYFMTDLYKDDLKNSRNNSKKLGSKGSKGDVTEQLGVLLKCLWSEKYNSEISIDFKAVVGKYNSQYKGSSQHDAQEFLLWLLDRIHEDLILPPPAQSKKKAKQSKSLVGVTRSQTDEELAEAAESSLTSSFVSKLFQGLHRSSLSCPHCGHLSNTFDPYLCVSLPLPQKCLRPMYVNVVALGDPTHAVTIGLSLNMYDTVRELREAVKTEARIPVEQIVLCELTKDGFYATFSNEQPLSDIPEPCRVYAVEMYSDDQQRESSSYQTPTIQLLLLHVEKARQPQRFCHPGVIRISREADTKQLQNEILHNLGDAVKHEVFKQNLVSLFKLQIVDGSSRKVYLPLEVEMPLYTQTVDRVLSMLGEEFGPQHLKLIVEWEPEIKEALIEDDEDHIEEHTSVNRVRALAQQPVAVSLNECFELYTQEEKLAGDDAWLCPHCKKPQKGASKTLGLWSLPDVLVLHLKRFKQTGMRRNKLNTLVEFPVENLDMQSHVVPHQDLVQHQDHMTYDLIAVTNHYGNMNGGHYTAFSKNTIDGTWQEYDDRHVRPLSERQVVSKAAYILFYQRRSLSKAVNQLLFTGNHWVFTSLHQSRGKPSSSSSPQRRRDSDGSPIKKRGGIQDDLEHVASTHFDRRVFSKEWNGQSSPTRRPTCRPLTPQPQRRQSSLEIGTYDQSPSVVKPRPSFRPSRPSLSRQVSDAAVRTRKQLYQDGGGEGIVDRRERGEEEKFGSKMRTGQTGSYMQPQVLQVQLPPKNSSTPPEIDRDILGSEVPKAQTSDILQPEQVQITPSHGRDMAKSSAAQQKASEGRESRDIVQSSKVPSSSSVHQLSQPAAVDVRVFDQGRLPPLPPASSSSSSSQRDSFLSHTGRPWQYESQSSRSSHDTHSSHDSQHSHSSSREQDPASRSPYSNGSSNGSEFYDWRQPEARVDRQSEKRNSGMGSSPSWPATAITSRVNSKPPLPPKILTRPADAGRSDSSSSSSPAHRQDDYRVTVTTPSLTSPPSPAPKDSVRDIQRRLTQQDPRPTHREPQLISQEPRIPKEPRLVQKDPRLISHEPKITGHDTRVAPKEPCLMTPERVPRGERFIALNQNEEWDTSQSDAERSDERHVLKDGEFEKRRSKIASQITGEEVVRRRRSQNMPDQKFATIGPCNRETRGESRAVGPPMVPRSSTDHSIHFNHYNQSSPSQPRYPTTYSPHSERGSVSSGSGGTPRSQWDRNSPGHTAVGNVPMYARENRDPNEHSVNKDTRHGIYRGPMFQHARPKKSSGDIPAPSLRESSV